MNETIHTDSAKAGPLATGHNRLRASDTSMLSGNEKAAPAALLRNAVQGAHDTVDRFADRAAPAAQRLGERVAAAGETLHAKTDQLRETRDEWVEGVRTTVRSKPMVSIAAAFALGALLARLIRFSR